MKITQNRQRNIHREGHTDREIYIHTDRQTDKRALSETMVEVLMESGFPVKLQYGGTQLPWLRCQRALGKLKSSL